MVFPAVGHAGVLSVLIAVALAIFCLLAAILDTMQRRIPNWLCVATAIVGLLLTSLLGEGLLSVGSHALHMFAALIAGIAIFALGMFGGGDAKFYSAVAAWFPISEAPRLLFGISAAGLALFLAWCFYRRARGYPIMRKTVSDFDSLPYGLAIGLGAIGTVLT